MEIVKKLLFSRKALLTLLLLLFVGTGTVLHIFTPEQFISFAEFTLGLYCGANVAANVVAARLGKNVGKET